MITIYDARIFSFSPTVNAYDFCQSHGFKWIPSKNKIPLTSWKSKGLLFAPDDSQHASKYKAMGVSELLIPTEENNLVVVDCDMEFITDEKDQRTDRDRTPTGLKNFYEFIFDNKLINFLFPICKDANSPFLFFKGLRKDPPFIFPEDHPLRAMVFTPTGGMHFYFRCKNAGQIKSSASEIAPKVDIRSRGGVIVSPYSYRRCDLVSRKDQNGKVLINPYYLPLGSWNDIPELPDELEKLLPHVEIEQAPVSIPYLSLSFNLSTRAGSYIKRLLEEYQKTPQGQRNTELNRLAGQAFRLSSYLSPSVIYDAFKAVGLASGLNSSEVHATLESAKKYGLNHLKKL